MSDIGIRRAPKTFSGIAELLALIQTAFAPMRGVVDPPSSAERLTLSTLADKIQTETLIVAQVGDVLVGCAFADARGDHLYLGKIAVAAAFQGKGVGRALLTEAIALAKQTGLGELRLETRVELIGNHRTFEACGFRRTGASAHAGFSRPTSYTYVKTL